MTTYIIMFSGGHSIKIEGEDALEIELSRLRPSDRNLTYWLYTEQQGLMMSMDDISPVSSWRDGEVDYWCGAPRLNSTKARIRAMGRT